MSRPASYQHSFAHANLTRPPRGVLEVIRHVGYSDVTLEGFQPPDAARSAGAVSGLRSAPVDVKDLACHEVGRFQIERIDDHAADRVQSGKLRMSVDGMHRRPDDAQRDRGHPD